MPGVAMLLDKDEDVKKASTPDFSKIDKKTVEKATAKKPTVKSKQTKK